MVEIEVRPGSVNNQSLHEAIHQSRAGEKVSLKGISVAFYKAPQLKK